MFLSLNTLNLHTINKSVEIYIYFIFTYIRSLDCRVPNGKNDLLGTVKDVQETSNTRMYKHIYIYIPTPNKEN